jgi:hypothetical protein
MDEGFLYDAHVCGIIFLFSFLECLFSFNDNPNLDFSAPMACSEEFAVTGLRIQFCCARFESLLGEIPLLPNVLTQAL